jgi:hypothetical protein
MWTLYRILLRMAVAWLAVVGLSTLVAAAAMRAPALDLAEMLGLVAFVPAALAVVVAWIVKPAQWTQ